MTQCAFDPFKVFYQLAAVCWKTPNLRNKNMVWEFKLNKVILLKKGGNVTIIWQCCVLSLVCSLPSVLVAGRKLPMCVYRLLQLLLFGPSAVAKLQGNTKQHIIHFLQIYIVQQYSKLNRRHCTCNVHKLFLLFVFPWSLSGIHRCRCEPRESFQLFPPSLPQPGGLQLLTEPVECLNCNSSGGEIHEN